MNRYSLLACTLAVVAGCNQGPPEGYAGGDTGLALARSRSAKDSLVMVKDSLLAEKEFAGQFHEGEKTNVHISIVAGRVILVVLFDTRSSLGLVRLRVKKASTELARILDDLVRKSQSDKSQTILAEITDDDIDNLFND